MRKLIKGSKEARDYMAKIRSKIKTVKIGAAGDYAKYEIAVIKKLASLLKKPYKTVLETVNLDHSLLDIISKNFDKKVTVLNCAKELKAKLILVAKKNPIQAFVEILSKLPKAQTKEVKPRFPIKLPATVTIGGLPIGFRGSWRGQPFYISNQYDIYGNVVCELTDSKTNEKFASVTQTSKVDLVIDDAIFWLRDRGIVIHDDQDLKYLHKEIKPLIVNLIKEVKAYNKKAHKRPTVKKAPAKKVKAQRLRPTKVAKKTSILKESHLLKNNLHHKGMIMPHGYQIKRSKSVVSGITTIGNILKQGKQAFLLNWEDVYNKVGLYEVKLSMAKTIREKNEIKKQIKHLKTLVKEYEKIYKTHYSKI
jgi:hypothetical protein